jgi:hypothetical protein
MVSVIGGDLKLIPRNNNQSCYGYITLLSDVGPQNI